MADSAHLEKMGRELKCPICLSLLNSAVSLTCNHVFCNLCIMKSMKSDSQCPVCKVPYRRREVRPAPHMDTLVSIYKSMEVASGINIFVSQTAPVKISAGQNELEGGPETGGFSQGKHKKQRILKGKGLKELVKSNGETYDPQPKPSFPAKKRVHVPQCLLSKTRTHTEQSEGLDNRAENEPKDGSIVLKEKPAFNEKGELVLSPFFWLREEDENDVERLSAQQTQDDHVTDTPLPNAPCFSDIKDSDDESPAKMIPDGKVHIQSKVADVFDSEMFEWTQRACSPELCSTPVKSQVAYQDKLDEIHEEKCEAASQIWTVSNGEEPISESAKSITYKQVNGNTNMGSLSLQKTKNAKVENGRKKLNRRGKRIKGRSPKKHVKISIGEVLEEVPTDSRKIAGGSSQGSRFFTSEIASNLEKKNCKRNKRASFVATAVNKVTEYDTTESIEAKINNQGKESIETVLPDLSVEKSKNDDNLKLKTSRSIKKITRYRKNHCKSLKNQDVDTVAEVLKEVPMNQNQGNENVTSQLSLSSCLKANDGKTYDLEDKTINSAKKIDMPILKSCIGILREKKRLKISTDDSAKNVLVDKALVGASKASASKTQIITGLQKDLEIRSIDNLETTKKVLSVAKDRFLQKCESFPGQIRCAFCHSPISSKASGEMMHYANGRPVAADYNEGSNIIHSHRNCTEWAPNVYFEDDIVINLESELARSRRIKCSCCGIKGAALGCYEKSCRKSFHVPCAKLVPQCLWDTENFVMLCPLHVSFKLPKEIFGSEGKIRKKSAPKGESQAKLAKVTTQHIVSESWLWKWPGSPHKWVICCSGLTVTEKGIVSEFTKMAGVLMSNTFGPNITHIIASTDENGACRRTLKFLMGILEGKWVLKIDWVKACMKAMEPVAEEQYEISVDIHGIRDGPRFGRLRVLSKQPKLFNGFKFYFMGEFIPSYKGYLQDLVVAAGGTVLQRKPVSGDQFGSSATSTFIIYSLELTKECDSRKKTLCKRRRDEAEALASLTGAKVAGHSWVLDSIAACKLQNLVKY